MTKRNGGRNISKKKLFPNAQRITKENGKRVWLLNGEEYETFNIMAISVLKELHNSEYRDKMSVKTMKKR